MKIVRLPACYVLKDAAGRSVAFVYFDEEPGRRNAAQLWTEAEALASIRHIARAVLHYGAPFKET